MVGGLKWIDLIVVLRPLLRFVSAAIASHALASTAILHCASEDQNLMAACHGIWQAVVTIGLYDEANWIAAEPSPQGNRHGDKVTLHGKTFVNDALAPTTCRCARPDGRR